MATSTYTPIATQTLGSAAASITFSSIPGTYTDLRLVLTGTSATGQNLQIQFNGDTATNYSDIILSGSGVSASSVAQTTASQIQGSYNAFVGNVSPSTYGIDIFSYAGSTNKTVLVTASGDFNGSGGVDLVCGLWRSTAAITQIVLKQVTGANFQTGTIATIWGI
jgi:hypothetical protein